MPYIVPLDIPKNCLECPFLLKPESLTRNDPILLGAKVCKCTISPAEIEESYTYATVTMLIRTKFKWCPLKETDKSFPMDMKSYEELKDDSKWSKNNPYTKERI